MAKAKFWQDGKSVDYINVSGANIEANSVVVIEKRIGIAGCDIPNNEKGALIVEGVFELPTNDKAVVKIGSELYWDKAAGAISATSGGSKILAGYAANTITAEDTKILVKINA